MSARTCLILAIFLLLLAPGLDAGNEDKDEQATKKADDELRKLVNEAIERGAKSLERTQQPDGSFRASTNNSYPMGATALSVLALLHCGHSRESDTVTKAFEHLRKTYAELKRGPGVRDAPGRRRRFVVGLRTYSVSVTIMALAEYGRTRKRSSEADERYGGAAGAGFALSPADLKWLKEMVAWLVSVQHDTGAWRYPEGGYDHSNAQYALLALKEARRVGVKIDEEVFVKALTHFVGAQERSGPNVPRYEEEGGDGVYSAGRYRTRGSDRARGWGYAANSQATGSMTAAGVAAVAICSSEIKESKHRKLVEKGEQAKRDGLAWLGQNFSVTENPKTGPMWHFYYLYGLERAGVLSRVVYMGKHRWYAEGARYLVDGQGPDGCWRPPQARGRGRGRGLVGPNAFITSEQCFALLFLARATARALGTVTEQPLIDLTGATDLPDRDAKNLLQAALTELAGLTDERARDRARDFAFFGPRVVGWLLPLLHDEDEAARARGVLVLRRITGLSFEYDPKAPLEVRETPADRWTSWYLANREAQPRPELPPDPMIMLHRDGTFRGLRVAGPASVG